MDKKICQQDLGSDAFNSLKSKLLAAKENTIITIQSGKLVIKGISEKVGVGSQKLLAGLKKLANLFKRQKPEPARINFAELPQWEQNNINETLRYAFSGTKPPKKIKQRWGSVFKNENKDLPKLGNNGKYKEFRVRHQPGTDNVHRMVIGSDGNMYYSWTHYGDIGKPAFVNIGTLTDAERIALFGS